MLHAFESKVLLSPPVTIIVFAVTGRAKAFEPWQRIAGIMVSVGCMEVNDIYRSCSSGETFRAIPDVAMLTFPSCLLLTLPGEAFPIFGILLSPFRFHNGLRLVGEYSVRYNVTTGTPVVGKCSVALVW